MADVGQGDWEEVNVVPADSGGVNFGWSIMEGAHCFEADTCDTAGLELPVVEYDHGVGCSITGGFVYRGEAMPGLVGHYFYSDFCAGFIRSFRLEAGEATAQRDWDVAPLVGVTSFGQDAAGELYVLTAPGQVLRIGVADP